MMPPTDSSENWDEFDWERALRESDRYAARYFQLLRRFYDLPAGNDLIADRMSEGETPDPDCDFDCDNCDFRWNCEFAMSNDWITGTEEDDDELPGFLDDDEDDVDPFHFEKHPVFVQLRQAVMGWCNIYSVMLPPEARARGLQALYQLGRSLATLAYSIDEDYYQQPAASVAFAKRSLAHLNQGLGLVERISREGPKLQRLMRAIREHLLKVREKMLEHLDACRSAVERGPEDEGEDGDED